MAIRAGRGRRNIIGKGWLALLSAPIVACALAACDVAPEGPGTGTVDPGDYRAFYLWPGVEPPRDLGRAEAVYVLWGELRKIDPDRVMVLFRGVPRGRPGELWLVVRAERTDWGEGAYGQLLSAADRWRGTGRLAGVQVDFDSSTGELRGYARFLSGLRSRLPADLKLSVTGLLDWPANASDADLAAMGAAIDEIVVQTYQGRATIAGYGEYIAAIERLPMPYRIALVEGGEWNAPPALARDPRFRGYVVFLLAGKDRD